MWLSYMHIERPSEIPAEYCPACDTEMLFSGTQAAGLAQFFCDVCDYRHDTLIDG